MMRYARIINGRVDHVVHSESLPEGYILAPDDVFGGDRFEDGQFVPQVPAPPADPREFMEIPRSVFARRAAVARDISWSDARDWANGTRLPQIARTLLEGVEEGERDEKEFTLLATDNIRRLAPEIIVLGASLGKTPAQLDAYFAPDAPNA